jgi:hypothetical protein
MAFNSLNSFDAFNERASNTTLSTALALNVPLQERLPTSRENRRVLNDYIDERFDLVMQQRRQFIEQFEQDTGMQLDATRRDSVAEAEHPNALAKASHGALDILLWAWMVRLGVVTDGWTQYNEKSTPRACLQIRNILEKGDEEMGIPIEALENREEWIARTKDLKFWFISLTAAFDFLSAFGIGANKFGTGLVRVEVVKFSQGSRCLFGIVHDASMQAWQEGEHNAYSGGWPPTQPCGCYEFKLLMKTIGNARRLPTAGADATMRDVAEEVRLTWMAANVDAKFHDGRWPIRAEESNPGVVMFGDEPFGVQYYQERHEQGTVVTAVRFEGRFGELL